MADSLDTAQVRELVERLGGLLAAASPGPWKTVPIEAEESELRAGPDEDDGVPHTDLFYEELPVVVERSEPGILVGHVNAAEPEARNVACLVSESDADRALILAARNDLPELVRVVSLLVEERDRLAREIVDRADTEQSMAQAMAEDGEEIARLRAPITAEMVRPLLCSIVSCEQHTAQAERIAADVNRARGLAPQE